MDGLVRVMGTPIGRLSTAAVGFLIAMAALVLLTGVVQVVVVILGMVVFILGAGIGWSRRTEPVGQRDFKASRRNR